MSRLAQHRRGLAPAPRSLDRGAPPRTPRSDAPPHRGCRRTCAKLVWRWCVLPSAYRIRES